MSKKLPLLGAGLLAGLVLSLGSLHAANGTVAPAAPSGGTSPASVNTAQPPAATPAAAAAAAAKAEATPTAGFKPDVSKLPAASDKKDLTFAKDIQPILAASCLPCHGGGTRNSGGFSVKDLDSILKTGANAAPGAEIGNGQLAGPAVVPGKAEQSPLLIYAAAGAGLVPAPALKMPTARAATLNPPAPALTADQLALIRAWINQGAK